MNRRSRRGGGRRIKIQGKKKGKPERKGPDSRAFDVTL